MASYPALAGRKADAGVNDARPQLPAEIARALDSLRTRIRRRFCLHGALWLIAIACGLLLLNYGLDRLLVLPAAVRLVFLGLTAAVLLRELRRRIVYPLTRSFSSDDMALAVERGFQELDQELISAVQLDPDNSRGDSAQLIRRVQTRAAASIAKLDVDALLTGRVTRRVGLLAGLGLSGLLVAAWAAPDSFGIWAARLLGATIAYPRKTFLTIDVPSGQGNYRITPAAGEGRDHPIRVALARGADLPVNVDVEGEIPAFVELQVHPLGNGGPAQKQTMSRRSAAHFRHVFRRLLHPIRLFASGGDDPGTREVHVTILTPPEVTDLAVEAAPPAYTGLARSRREGGLVEALPGSRIEVSFRSTEPLEKAWLHFQETGERLDCIPDAPSDGGGPAGAPDTRHVGRFEMPAKADRYRIHLLARNGLKELSPGLHSVAPVLDRKPRLRLLTPGSSLQALTPQAAFPLRFVATDDFGLTKITLGARLGPQSPVHEQVLWEWKASGQPSDAAARRRRTFLRLVSPKELLPQPDRQPREGDRLSCLVQATDNRLPESQTGLAQAFKIDLLDVEELRRRLQARLRNTRRTVERALKVQQEHENRVDTFLAEASEGSALSESRRRLGLTAAEAGQQRVRGFLLQIRGDMAEVLDAHIFNGLDSSPALADVVATYMGYYEKHMDAPATDPGFYVELGVARKTGRVGSLDLIGKLGDMFVIAHRVLEEPIAASLRSLAEASTADTEDKFHESMRVVQKSQAGVVTGLTQLLRLLEDWNDYQDVVRMTRRLRDAERDLMERIRLGR